MPSRKRGAKSESSRQAKRSREEPPPTNELLTSAQQNKDGCLDFNEEDVHNLIEPFVTQAILLKLYLSKNKKAVTGKKYPLVVSLLCDGGNKAVPTDMYDVEGAEISTDGEAPLQITINALSKNFTGKHFILSVKVADSSMRVKELLTEPFTVVSQRLKVVNEAPNLWFKDEGGRDKAIELSIELTNKLGVHKLRDVPLLVTLHYDTEGYPQALMHTKAGGDDSVQLLQMARDSDPIVRHGQAIIKVRINDVSKNHMTHAFIVKIGPNTMKDPELRDIAAAYSTPIVVKSKRNSSQKKKLAAARKKKGIGGSGGSSGRSGSSGSSGGSGGSGGSRTNSGSAVLRRNSRSQAYITAGPQITGTMNNPTLQELELPTITPAMMANIKTNNITVEYAGGIIGHWGAAVNKFLEETNDKLNNLMLFNNQIAQPLLRRVSVIMLCSCSSFFLFLFFLCTLFATYSLFFPFYTHHMIIFKSCNNTTWRSLMKMIKKNPLPPHPLPPLPPLLPPPPLPPLPPPPALPPLPPFPPLRLRL